MLTFPPPLHRPRDRQRPTADSVFHPNSPESRINPDLGRREFPQPRDFFIEPTLSHSRGREFDPPQFHRNRSFLPSPVTRAPPPSAPGPRKAASTRPRPPPSPRRPPARVGTPTKPAQPRARPRPLRRTRSRCWSPPPPPTHSTARRHSSASASRRCAWGLPTSTTPTSTCRSPAWTRCRTNSNQRQGEGAGVHLPIANLEGPIAERTLQVNRATGKRVVRLRGAEHGLVGRKGLGERILAGEADEYDEVREGAGRWRGPVATRRACRCRRHGRRARGRARPGPSGRRSR